MGDRPTLTKESVPGQPRPAAWEALRASGKIPTAKHGTQALPAGPRPGSATNKTADTGPVSPPSPAALLGVNCDQAVFTSVRSATGEGYRLIAASPGVRTEEKVEITRRSPSHESLFDRNAEPVGLSVSRLGTGRWCVQYSCHAGHEHTGRGGARVYTQMAILEPEDYRSFNGDPVRIHARLAQVVARQGPLLKTLPSLERLTLPVTRTPIAAAPPIVTGGTTAEWVWSVASQMLARDRILLVHPAEPFHLVRWILLALPLRVRETLDVSAGVQFSPSRAMQLAIVPGIEDRVRCSLTGRDVRVLRTTDPAPGVRPDHAAWFDLLRRWWREGKQNQIVELTADPTIAPTAEAMAERAGECEEEDRRKVESERSAAASASRKSGSATALFRRSTTQPGPSSYLHRMAGTRPEPGERGM